MYGGCSESQKIDLDATWSPDGKQIAYRRREPSGTYIYIGTIDGKKEERVAIGAGPTWAPDGTEIAFLSGYGSGLVRDQYT